MGYSEPCNIQLCVTIEKLGVKQASRKLFLPQAAWAYYQQQIMWDIQSPKNWLKRTIHTVMSYN